MLTSAKKKKTLRDKTACLLIKGAVFEVMGKQHIKGLHMLPYTFKFRHCRWYHGSRVLEHCLEGKTTWRKEHLIGYSSKGWLWDSQSIVGLDNCGK